MTRSRGKHKSSQPLLLASGCSKLLIRAWHWHMLSQNMYSAPWYPKATPNPKSIRGQICIVRLAVGDQRSTPTGTTTCTLTMGCRAIHKGVLVPNPPPDPSFLFRLHKQPNSGMPPLRDPLETPELGASRNRDHRSPSRGEGGGTFLSSLNSNKLRGGRTVQVPANR
jgi:hypothetical protein